MPNYIDIHTHTYYESADTTILLNVFAGDSDSLKKSAYKSVGLHPWHIDDRTWENKLMLMEESLQDEKVIAIGETGLDRTIAASFDLQNQVFISHLKMGEALRKPLIIHCVRSYSEMLAYRKKSDQEIPWIFHWFNADIQIARELVKKNCYLSFGHMLFSEQSRAFRTFTQIPAEHLFFETDDAGYTIREVYDRAAQLRNISAEDLKTGILNNFNRCFQL